MNTISSTALFCGTCRRLSLTLDEAGRCDECKKPIYTGYAVWTQQRGYVCVSRDIFSRGLCYWPCSRQTSPWMTYTAEDAERAVSWLNANFDGIGAVVKPLRYSDGMWIDQP